MTEIRATPLAPAGRQLDAEALRFHQLLTEHTILATTERYRPDRAADVDDNVVKNCPCGNRYVPPNLCGTCGAHFPVSGNENGES